MKKIVMLICIATLMAVGYASPIADTPDRPENGVEVVLSISGTDCSDGVSYEIYWYSALEEYVIKFYNNTDSYVQITYQFRVKDGENSSHWRDGYAGCSSGGTSDYNPAGEWGDVRDVEYERK